MIRDLIFLYLGGWVASAAPFYTTAKATNPNEPLRNILRAFILSVAWIVTIIPIAGTIVKDVIARFTPKTPGATGSTGPTV